MKRSGQVLLVVMGVTSATAAGHYLTTPNECVQQAPTAQPKMVTQQPCRNTSGTRTGSRSWWGSSGSSSSEHTKVASNSSTSATRGGFGGTGHGFSSGS
jgi:hypothetical protein